MTREEEAIRVFDEANLLCQAGEPLRALRAYEKAIELKPDLFAVWHGKGVALFCLGRLGEAREAWERARQLHPKGL